MGAAAAEAASGQETDIGAGWKMLGKRLNRGCGPCLGRTWWSHPCLAPDSRQEGDVAWTEPGSPRNTMGRGGGDGAAGGGWGGGEMGGPFLNFEKLSVSSSPP